MSNTDLFEQMPMTDTELLEQIIKDKGVKKGKLVEALDTSYKWLSKKINNEKSFKAYEIQILCDVLGIEDLELKNRIFFAVNVGK
jgi:hypothetical protein